MNMANQTAILSWPYQQFKLLLFAFFWVPHNLTVCWPYQQFKLFFLTSCWIPYNLIGYFTTSNSFLSPPPSGPAPKPNGPFRQFRPRYIPIDPSPPPSSPLLPPSDKKTLFIDLDKTLIFSFINQPPSDQYSLTEQLVLRYTSKTYYVVKRPYVTKLLRSAVASGFEIIIFTASGSNYASSILDWLDPETKFITHRLYRDACTMDLTGSYFKDLDISGRPADQSVVIDDTPKLYWKHYDNVIPVEPFKGDKSDKELKKLLSFFEFERQFNFQDLRCAVSLYCHFKQIKYN